MANDDQNDKPLDLDLGKLLGFRNLLEVAAPDSDVTEISDLAFTKRGREAVA